MPKTRECDEEPRVEGTRRKKVNFKYEDVKKHFQDNLKDIKEKFSLADREKATDLHSAEEIWRCQIVFLDSALDFYIHEVAKLGITKIFNTEWEETQKYKKLKVSMEFALKLADSVGKADDLLGEIDGINQRNCFMSFDNLQTVLHLVGLDADKTKKDEINALYRRRNQIAHQSDRLPDNPEKQPITEEDVRRYLDLVEKFVEDINSRIEAKDSESEG